MNRTALPMTLAWLLTLGLLGFLEEEVRSKEASHAKAEGKIEGKKGRRASGKKDPALVPIVAPLFTEGMEVVIRPMPDKLKALRVSLEQFRKLRYQRFFRGEWRTEISGKEIDLTKVATLSVRKLHAPPFTVLLPDGRKVRITPKPKRIGASLITGELFEEDVRKVLAEPLIRDPAKAHVLHGIQLVGRVHMPNYWGKDHVHISLGEPLERFAKVKIYGRKGPQAADLERMRQIRILLAKTLAKEEKTSRKVFEKRFGPGKKTQDPDKSGWLYPVGAGQLQVWYESEPDLVSSISYWSGPEPEPGEPRDYGKEARTVWQMDRAFLLA